MLVPEASAAGSAVETSAPVAVTVQACLSPSRRLVSATRATEVMLASASPRKPRLATRSRSSSEAILLVAWRASARRNCSRAMPPPSSTTLISLVPPPASWTEIAPAPASRLFSRSSFRADAGRSTTSPAAIWLIRSSGRTRMLFIPEL